MPYPYLTIFLAGKHKTAHSKKEWTDGDLDTVLAATIANSANKIPFTAQTDEGKHPSGNLPVFGYADKSTLRKTSYKGAPALEIQPCEFAEGLFDKLKSTPMNKMSVRLDGADFSLEHICFVERPAVADVPALSTYDFSATSGKQWIDLSADIDSAITDADFADTRMDLVGRALRGLRDWLIGKEGLEKANQILPDYGFDELTQYQPEVPAYLRESINDLRSRVAAMELEESIEDSTEPNENISFSQIAEDDMKELEELKAAAAQDRADFAAYKGDAEKRETALSASNEAMKKQVAAMQDAGTQRENADFVDGLIREGKMLPAERDLTLQDLALAAKMEAKINFAGVEKDMLTAKRELLTQRPVIAPLGGQIATKDRAVSGSADFSLTEPEGRNALVEKAKQLAKERTISFAEAIDELVAEGVSA